MQDGKITSRELRSQLRARLSSVRDELHSQRVRLNELLTACQATAAGVAADRTTAAPRLFAREQLVLGEAVIEVARQAVRHPLGSHRFTPTEWQLLTFLLANPEVVHTRLELAAGAWGAGFAERNSEVEVYVSRLRRKLGPASRLLETVRGQGYRLLLESPATTAVLRGVITLPVLDDEELPEAPSLG